MKKEYRGFFLESKKDKYITGEQCFTMFGYRISDGWILIDNSNPSMKNHLEAINDMRYTVDDHIKHPEDYK